MFIPIVIPVSVKTHKKWIMDIMDVSFLGGYLIMLFALVPPLISALIVGKIFSLAFNFSQESKDYGILILFLSGVLLFIWDRWLKFSYDTEIKLIYIPIEYLSYVILFFGLILIYV